MTEDKGHVRCRTIIEVLGKPREYVENSIKKYIDHIKEDSELVILNEEFSEIKEQSLMFSQFVELDLVIKGTPKLISFCFEYMPSSIEVIKPEHFSMTNPELSSFLNDLQARLHSVDMVVKQQKSENDFLKHNLNTIISNSIILSLKISPLKLDHLSKMTGISEKEIGIFTEKMLKDNKIKKEGDIYRLS